LQVVGKGSLNALRHERQKDIKGELGGNTGGEGRHLRYGAWSGVPAYWGVGMRSSRKSEVHKEGRHGFVVFSYNGGTYKQRGINCPRGRNHLVKVEKSSDVPTVIRGAVGETASKKGDSPLSAIPRKHGIEHFERNGKRGGGNEKGQSRRLLNPMRRQGILGDGSLKKGKKRTLGGEPIQRAFRIGGASFQTVHPRYFKICNGVPVIKATKMKGASVSSSFQGDRTRGPGTRGKI